MSGAGSEADLKRRVFYVSYSPQHWTLERAVVASTLCPKNGSNINGG